MSETARNSDRVASPGGRCSISRERQLPHGNDRSSGFVISQMSFLSDKLQTSSLSESQDRQRSSSRFCYFIVRCLIRASRIILIKRRKEKETARLPVFRSSRFGDRTRWHKLVGKFANIILAITTLSLFYFSIFYFRVDQRGSRFLLFLLDRYIFTIDRISYRLRIVRRILRI